MTTSVTGSPRTARVRARRTTQRRVPVRTGAAVQIKDVSKQFGKSHERFTALQRVDLTIEDGEFAWASDAPTPTLEGISLNVRKGELVGVYGRVGAGKTSLASAIIGDMHRREGSVQVSGTIAYASQNPWIMSVTVRDNILFSHEYDETFYNLVLDGELGPSFAEMGRY